MSDRACFLNENGVCVEHREFPAKRSDCRFKQDGLCAAKPENLTTICPDCGDFHKTGECDENDEATCFVPKSK